MFGCAYGGYVPPPPPLKPLAESEMDIRYLPMGKLRTAKLECVRGICRVRYRIVAPSSGEMTVTVKRAASEEKLPDTSICPFCKAVDTKAGGCTSMRRIFGNEPPVF